TTKSQTRASPQVGWSRVARILIVVVFPAPLGPMNPKQSPSLISRLRFDKATSVPYRLVRLTVLITAAIQCSGRFIRKRARCGRTISLRHPERTREGSRRRDGNGLD